MRETPTGAERGPRTRGLVPALLAALGTLSLSSCAPPHNCTAVGGPPSGIEVLVDGSAYPSPGKYSSDICADDPSGCATATYTTTGDHAVQHVLRLLLTSEPVTVHVTLRHADGAVVYTASTTGRPHLVQPNGPGCGPGTSVLSLVATPPDHLQLPEASTSTRP